MYLKVPGDVKVTRKRVTPGFDWARFARSCGAGDKNPEFTLSEVELITACRAPSKVGSTFAEGGRGSAGSVPKVTVWLIDGSRLVHSTVSPTPTTIVSCPKRIRDAVCEPAPVMVTISPTPAATSLPCQVPGHSSGRPLQARALAPSGLADHRSPGRAEEPGTGLQRGLLRSCPREPGKQT